MAYFAAIDVGSNAIRLRMVETFAGAKSIDDLRPILELRAAIRLGADVFADGRLSATSIDRACEAFVEFRDALAPYAGVTLRATATSAVRDASNRSTFVERIERESGIRVEVIEGVEEARLIQLAIQRKIDTSRTRNVLIDVGGGSTEITLLDDGEVVFSESLALGTVRLLEFVKSAPAKKRTALMMERIERGLSAALPVNPRSKRRKLLSARPIDKVLGTGGNIETLAGLCSTEATGIQSIKASVLRDFEIRLRGMSLDERIAEFKLRVDRADTIAPATAIYALALAHLGHDQILVPGTGLKEGILCDLVEHAYRADPATEERTIENSCRRLGKKYQYDEPHAAHVATLARSLFDQTRDIHRLDDRDRSLLVAAAHLHDIGDFVRNDGHHKHSYYLILHSDVMGLSREERTVVANVARYHRKSLPEKTHANFRELDPVSRSKIRALAALLRVADGLDNDHLQQVRGLRVTVHPARRAIECTVDASGELALEKWTANLKANLFREVFGYELLPIV